jgi:hypothetical protein
MNHCISNFLKMIINFLSILITSFNTLFFLYIHTKIKIHGKQISTQINYRQISLR